MPILTDEDGNQYEVPAHLLDPDAPKPKFRQELEDKAAQASQREAEAVARAEAAERRIAFAEAGVPLSDPRAKYFVKGYEGELTAEAIKAEAAAFGLTGPPTPTPQALPQSEVEALTTMGQAADGTTAPGQRDWAAEYRAAEQLPGTQGIQAVERLAAEQGIPVV